MSKKGKNESRSGGSALPASAIRRRVAQVERSLNEKFRAKGALRLDASKHLLTLQQTFSNGASENKETARAIAGLRSFSERLAKRKVVAPAAPRLRSGIVFGQYVATFTPPQFNPLTNSQILDGDPTVSDTADGDNGQINLSIVSDPENPSEAWAWAELYFNFRLPFGPGTLSASAIPSIAYSWFVNAIQDTHHDALSEASLSFGIITTSRTTGAFVGENVNPYPLWSEMQTNQLDFDFGSQTVPVFAETNVGADDECHVFLSCMCHVVALGWQVRPAPGGPSRSLAGATVALTLPSITLDLNWNPVNSPVSAR